MGWHRKRKGGTEIGCSAEADICVQTVSEQLDCLGLVETQLLCLGEAQLLVTRVGYSLLTYQVRLQSTVSITTLGLGLYAGSTSLTLKWVSFCTSVFLIMSPGLPLPEVSIGRHKHRWPLANE